MVEWKRDSMMRWIRDALNDFNIEDDNAHVNDHVKIHVFTKMLQLVYQFVLDNDDVNDDVNIDIHIDGNGDGDGMFVVDITECYGIRMTHGQLFGCRWCPPQ